MNLKSILDDHKAWLAGDGGCRANLYGANLSGADLCGADLCRADLSGANLRGAEGVLALPISEPRGYRHIAVLHGAEWVIFAGCRRYTIAEARAHWCSDDYDGPASVRDTYPAALEWLAKHKVLEAKK